MAGNWLGGGESIAQGWGQEPSLSAPNIGYTLAAILKDRRDQQEAIQKNIADTIKNVQTQRQTSAYTDALRNAGLTQGHDISGLDATHATELAKLIADNTPDTDEDTYHKALAREANAKADLYGKYPSGGGDSDEPDTYTDPDSGQVWRKSYGPNGRVNWYPVKSPTAAKPQTQGDLKSELANIGINAEGIRNSTGQYGVLPDGTRVPAGHPWTDASTIYVPPAEGNTNVPLTLEKFRHLKKALGIPDPDPTPAPSPGATPGQTPDGSGGSPVPAATPRTTPIPSDQAGGHASNYGVPPGGAGGAQAGQLVPGQSRKYAFNQWWVWQMNPQTGKPQWTPE